MMMMQLRILCAIKKLTGTQINLLSGIEQKI